VREGTWGWVGGNERVWNGWEERVRVRGEKKGKEEKSGEESGAYEGGKGASVQLWDQSVIDKHTIIIFRISSILVKHYCSTQYSKYHSTYVPLLGML
jgi:hypothetical protein